MWYVQVVLYVQRNAPQGGVHRLRVRQIVNHYVGEGDERGFVVSVVELHSHGTIPRCSIVHDSKIYEAANSMCLEWYDRNSICCFYAR